MDTKQKTRSGGNTQRDRSAEKKNTRPAQKQAPKKTQPAAKRKKEAPLASLLGGGKKKTAKRPAASTSRKPRPQERQRSRSDVRAADEEARRAEAAARRRAEQAASAAQAAASREPEQAIPEMVFTAEQVSRVRTPEENKRAAMRRRSAKRVQERKKEEERKKKRPAVAYTQPMPFNLNRLLLQISVVVAVVLAVVIGLSVFFKVETVRVYGNEAYSAWAIQEASGIEGGENLLTFGRTRACGKITTALPYVKTVRIGIKLPDTVNIYIEEFDVAYSIESVQGSWWLMTSDGKVAEQINDSLSGNYTKIEGVRLQNPEMGKKAVAEETVVTVQETTAANETQSTEPTSPLVTVTGNDRLQAALLILQALEANDIVGEVASFDVSSLLNIEMMYGTRYQVKLGDTSNMEYKIQCMKQAVSQFNDYETGILDISFTTWTDRPGFTPLG